MIGAEVGRLTITRKLGEGGMGAVYLAQHQILGQPAVVKVLLPQWSSSPVMIQRFINEARAASSIRHPGIVQVGDCGQLGDGSWYITMEYLDGGTLAEYLASHGPISEQDALEILAPMADALEAAHARGIVHRDLKPENVFLISTPTQRAAPKILDFGICKLSEDASGGFRTDVGMVAGTLGYMAPEQILNMRGVDRRSDVYALGVIAYEMLTGGSLPYPRTDSPTAYYELQKHTPPVDPRTSCPSISDGVRGAILAALQFDPARRPPTARDFILLLAKGIVGDRFLESGIDIVRRVAAPLLLVSNLAETVRSPKPSAPGAGAWSSRYQLHELLGAGGMAEVFRATMVGAEQFSRTVAIKRILPEFAKVTRFASMFIDEARLVSRLSHPNIVTVLDFNRDDAGELCLVMEYVEGKDLHSALESGPLPHSVAIFVISEVLRGLHHAHVLPTTDGVRGLVHRDVSPSNVLLSWEGAVKVSDFGLAKARQATEASGSIQIKGKPAFMSPEQIDGRGLDGRSDLFSVGVMLWEILTGERLFWLDDIDTTIQRLMYRPIPRPSAFHSVEPDLEVVVMRMLEREPMARYATAELAVEALAACVDAPRNGRGELERLLATRFPEDLAARGSPRDGSPAMASPRQASKPATAPVQPPVIPAPKQATELAQPVADALPTTLAGASGAMAGKATRRWKWSAIAAAVGLTAGVGAFLVVRAGADSPVTFSAGARPPSLVVDQTARASSTGSAESPIRTPVTPHDEAVPATSAAVPIHASGEVPASHAASVHRSDVSPSVIPDPGPALSARPPNVAAVVQKKSAPEVVKHVPSAPAESSIPGTRSPVTSRATASPEKARSQTGEIVIYVQPWADIRINGKDVGQTPYRARLPVGRYHLRLMNPDSGKSENMMITVTADQTKTVQLTW